MVEPAGTVMDLLDGADARFQSDRRASIERREHDNASMRRRLVKRINNATDSKRDDQGECGWVRVRDPRTPDTDKTRKVRFTVAHEMVNVRAEVGETDPKLELEPQIIDLAVLHDDEVHGYPVMLYVPGGEKWLVPLDEPEEYGFLQDLVAQACDQYSTGEVEPLPWWPS